MSAETEVIVEAVAEDPMLVEIRAQMKTTGAVRKYLLSVENFERASKEFNESCIELRACIKPSTTFVVRSQYHKHHLVTTDAECNFSVEPIEVI